ncbi:MAG: hypothetical protein FWJ94_00185 [Acidimicrobiia bacterium]
MTTPGGASPGGAGAATAPGPGGARGAAAPPAAGPPAARRAASGERRLGDRALAALTAALTLPVLWMGYGTDIDVPDVLRAGESIRRGDYLPSRPPGVPVFEAVVAALDPIGGHLLINLATAVAGGATVLGIARLVREWGHVNGDVLAVAFLVSPATLIASTSTADFVWATAFLVWGALWLGRDRPVPAGVLLALAVGTRLSSALLVAAVLVADGWDPAHRRRCARAALVALPLSVLLYVPSWLAYDRSAEVLDTAEGWRGVANNLGRFAYKNYATAGPALLVVVAVAAPALVAALRRWGDDPLLRLGVGAFAVSEALFFVLPWKYNHLLPALLGLLLWLGATRRNHRRFLWVLVVAVAVNGLVAFRPLAPDEAEVARSGRWDPALVPGLLVNDIACRLDAMHEDPPPYNRVAWPCTLKPLRGATDDGADGRG